MSQNSQKKTLEIEAEVTTLNMTCLNHYGVIVLNFKNANIERLMLGDDEGLDRFKKFKISLSEE